MNRKGNDAALVNAAADGLSYAKIAQKAGVSISTVKRRLADPMIQQAIGEVRLQQRREHAAQSSAIMSDVLQRLPELIRHEDPHIALRAMSLAASTNLRFVLFVDHEERLHQLEVATEQQMADDNV